MTICRLMAALALAGCAVVSRAEARQAFENVGMEQVSAPVSGDAAVPLTIWYPSRSAAHVQAMGPYRMEVAMAGEPVPESLPLIVISHGTGGSAFNSAILGLDLAKAGFVVAAVEHGGDNYRDRSRSFSAANFSSRPRQISAAIDYLTRAWRFKDMVDPARIGLFGHSAGGTTALIVSGGVLDWGRVARYCTGNAADWGCRNSRDQRAAAKTPAADGSPIAAPDPRVKALVIAAPALAHGFQPGGLASVRLPVQLWVAGRDAIVTDAGTVADLMQTRPERHVVAKAGHFSFLAPCSDELRKAVPAICEDPGGFDRERFQQAFAGAMERFFRAKLRK